LLLESCTKQSSSLRYGIENSLASNHVSEWISGLVILAPDFAVLEPNMKKEKDSDNAIPSFVMLNQICA
jgi:hypothetical protein